MLQGGGGGSGQKVFSPVDEQITSSNRRSGTLSCSCSSRQSRCRRRSRALSTATTPGIASCSAMVDSECPRPGAEKNTHPDCTRTKSRAVAGRTRFFFLQGSRVSFNLFPCGCTRLCVPLWRVTSHGNGTPHGFVMS